MKAIGMTQGQARGITVLRVVVGIVFVMHGRQKLFIYGFNGVAGFLGRVGIPLPLLSALVVTGVEFLGGAALMLGLLTRWAAVLLGINMLVAMVVVHLRAGFFLPNGFEYTLTLQAASNSLALTGPGEAAVDTALDKRRA